MCGGGGGGGGGGGEGEEDVGILGNSVQHSCPNCISQKELCDILSSKIAMFINIFPFVAHTLKYQHNQSQGCRFLTNTLNSKKIYILERQKVVLTS